MVSWRRSTTPSPSTPRSSDNDRLAPLRIGATGLGLPAPVSADLSDATVLRLTVAAKLAPLVSAVERASASLSAAKAQAWQELEAKEQPQQGDDDEGTVRSVLALPSSSSSSSTASPSLAAVRDATGAVRSAKSNLQQAIVAYTSTISCLALPSATFRSTITSIDVTFAHLTSQCRSPSRAAPVAAVGVSTGEIALLSLDPLRTLGEIRVGCEAEAGVPRGSSDQGSIAGLALHRSTPCQHVDEGTTDPPSSPSPVVLSATTDAGVLVTVSSLLLSRKQREKLLPTKAASTTCLVLPSALCRRALQQAASWCDPTPVHRQPTLRVASLTADTSQHHSSGPHPPTPVLRSSVAFLPIREADRVTVYRSWQPSLTAVLATTVLALSHPLVAREGAGHATCPQFAVASLADGSVRVVSLALSLPIVTYWPSFGTTYGLALSPAHHLAAFGGEDGTLYLASLTTHTVRLSVCLSHAAIVGVAFSVTGSLLAVATSTTVSTFSVTCVRADEDGPSDETPVGCPTCGLPVEGAGSRCRVCDGAAEAGGCVARSARTEGYGPAYGASTFVDKVDLFPSQVAGATPPLPLADLPTTVSLSAAQSVTVALVSTHPLLLPVAAVSFDEVGVLSIVMVGGGIARVWLGETNEDRH